MSKELKLVSLFAGAGGLDIGLEQAGFTTCFANELEDSRAQTLRYNRELPNLSTADYDTWFHKVMSQKCYRGLLENERLKLKRRWDLGRRRPQRYLQEAVIASGSISDITSQDILAAIKLRRGEAALVAGGPPCQPFSRAGKRENIQTADGRLFTEFVRVVDDLRPRFFLFENVKGLILTKTDVWKNKCEGCGAITLPPFVDRNLDDKGGADQQLCRCGSPNWSVIQNLIKGGTLEIIIAEFERLGYTCNWQVLNAADYGAAQIRERLLLIGSRDNEPVSWPVASYGRGGQRGQLKLFDSDKKPWREMAEIWADGHDTFGALDLEKAVLWVRNVVRPHDEPVTWSLHRPSPTIGAHQAAKLALAPDGVPEEQLLRQQWHVVGKRQKDLPPVKVKYEFLSDQELLELQTFPKGWYLHGTRMDRAFQIGNAVPPILAREVGAAIMASIASRELVSK